MVEFVTRSDLRQIASNLRPDDRASMRRRAAQAPTSMTDRSTFLSHSSKDGDLVIGAMRVLENHGARVYIDEIDPEMPPYTSDETARLLKSRIRQTQRFVLLASKNSKDSRWVPWELGVADGYKGLPAIALFPSADDPSDMDWASWEYLGLYARIVWGRIKGDEKEHWIVLDHREFSAIPLERWIAGGAAKSA